MRHRSRYRVHCVRRMNSACPQRRGSTLVSQTCRLWGAPDPCWRSYVTRQTAVARSGDDLIATALEALVTMGELAGAATIVWCDGAVVETAAVGLARHGDHGADCARYADCSANVLWLRCDVQYVSAGDAEEPHLLTCSCQSDQPPPFVCASHPRHDHAPKGAGLRRNASQLPCGRARTNLPYAL